MSAREERRAEFGALAFVLLLGLIAIAPLLQPGYFWGAHDARHDVYFIHQYHQSVQDGAWLARWAPDFSFGYGYPFFIVYGPAAPFLGEVFHGLLGLGYEESAKAVLALSMLLSGFAMYAFLRSWLGRAAGVVAAAAYLFAPYHLVDVYVRAAMAESLALAFLPLALWGFREAVIRPRFLAIAGAGLAFAALMWTSNLVSLVFAPALGLYVATLIWHTARHAGDGPLLRRLLFRAVAPAAGLLLGLGLSAAFFVPAIVEQGFINRSQWFGAYYDPAQHFVYFHQLFSPAWGFGISQPGPVEAANGGLSFQLGVVPVVLSAVALALSGRFERSTRFELRVWAVWGLVAVFLTLGASAWVWEHVPPVGFAQFPWRYLMLAILPLAILPGALAADERAWPAASGSARGAGAVILALLLALGSYAYLKVEIRPPTKEQGPVSYPALMRFQRTADEMTGVTVWVDPEERPNWSPMADEWVRGREVTTRVDYATVPQNETLAVNSEDVGALHEQVYYFAKEPGRSITFNRFWYPGWRAWLLDGKDGRPVAELPVEREAGPLARLVVQVPAGEGFVLLRFGDTPLRSTARWVTIGALSLLAVIVAAGWLRRGRLR
jgi:hypothetical protein